MKNWLPPVSLPAWAMESAPTLCVCGLPFVSHLIVQPGPPVSRGEIARQWIAALHDEVVDDAVEFHAVVEIRVGELLEVGDGQGRVFLEEIGDDSAVRGLERGLFWHAKNLTIRFGKRDRG